MNTPDRFFPDIARHQKIGPDHLQRLACVYIRQSTMKQVHSHRESQVNQYHLVERAEALGWNRQRIRVIDTDQGLSGQGSGYRQGFKELVAEVSLGHVGIVFGYEVSRLARNNSDWYHLLDIAAVFGTLIADNDGLYDPRFYNDRLLLGLKGTMSEAELHLLRQRLDAGRLSKVRRGEYRQHLPTGLMRLPDGTVVKDPDAQIRHTIELVFAKFLKLGSGQQVLRYLCENDLLLPRQQRAGLYNGELLWRRPTDSAIYEILHNPAYAGAFVYGRKQVDPTRRQPGRRATGQIIRPMAEWIHVQQDVYPAYITWEQYLANQERLHQNAMRYTQRAQRAQGAAREGAGLLQGLVTCGRCGRVMRVAYKHTPRYFCSALLKGFRQSSCSSLHGPSIDQAVVQAFFDAIRPSQLDALEALLNEQQVERQRLEQQWQERLKRAQYQAHLAQRQYNAVDPENRLVATELERRWEEKLCELQATQEDFEHFQQTSPVTELSPELRKQFRHISETLPQLWPSLTNTQKKELLRSLITRVILKRETPDRIEIRIVWISGHYSIAYVRPPIHRQQDVSSYDEMVGRIRMLYQKGLSDQQMAEQLNAEGFRSAHALDITPAMVLKIRMKQRWLLLLGQSRNALSVQGHLTPRGLAARLGIERSWVYRHICNGVIDPRYVIRHPQGVYLIKDSPDLIVHLRQLIRKSQTSTGAKNEDEPQPNSISTR